MTSERDEANSIVIRKEPCPKCGSKDNLVRYADLHAHCYTPGCGHFERKKEENDVQSATDARSAPRSGYAARSGEGDVSQLLDPKIGQWGPLDKRKLLTPTLKRYGYFVANFRGQTAHLAPYYSQGGEVVAQKVRLPSKDFPVLKGQGYTRLQDCKLFGQHVYGDKNDKRVVITEGEIDAMSVAQVVDFKMPCVSVGTGSAGAAEHLKANYRWLDRFEEIVLFFDNDEPGKKAAEECAKLFKIGKVKIAKMAEFKDASDALQANKPGAITEAIYAAEAWRPKGVVNAADCWADFEKEKESAKWTFPWPTLNEMTGGIGQGHAILIVSGTGMGKSVIVNETVIDVALKQGAKIGCMFFEATRREAQEGLMTIKASKRVHLEPLSIEEKRAIHAATFGSRQIELYDQETAERGLEAVMSYIRYLARALDCDGVVVDPLSFVVAGEDLSADERRVLDKASRDFADLAKELGIFILISHHLSKPSEGKSFEEGRHITLNNIRGSGGIAAFMTTVIGLEGNQQGPVPTLRRFRVAKARVTGRTGLADRLEFSFETGRYTTTDRDYEKEEDGDAKPNFGGKTSSDY